MIKYADDGKGKRQSVTATWLHLDSLSDGNWEAVAVGYGVDKEGARRALASSLRDLTSRAQETLVRDVG